MNPPTRPKRTVREISHLFLSAAETPSALGHTPLVGCYFTKGVKEVKPVLGQLFQDPGPSAKPTQLWYVKESAWRITGSERVLILPVSTGEIKRALVGRLSEAALEEETRSGLYGFLLRDEECSVLDRLIPLLTPMVIVALADGKDFYEVFKFVKGFKDEINFSGCFIRFFPEPAAGTAQLLLDELNKVIKRFFKVELLLAHSSTWRGNSPWYAGSGALFPPVKKRQREVTILIERGLQRGQDISK